METAIQINNSLSSFLGIEPLFVFAIAFLVWVLGNSLKIRSRFPNYSDLILTGLCLTFSALFSVFGTELEVTSEIVKHTLILSALCTLTYKFMKPGILFLIHKFEKVTDEDIDESEILGDSYSSEDE